MSRDLQLLGRAKRTHDGYLREVRKLACYFNLSPDKLTQQQVADYLLYLINDKQFAPGSLKVTYSALKFFFTHTCPRDWQVLNKLKVPKQKTLPTVLTRNQVEQLIATVNKQRNAALLWTLYCLALRLEEGLSLQIDDIDAETAPTPEPSVSSPRGQAQPSLHRHDSCQRQQHPALHQTGRQNGGDHQARYAAHFAPQYGHASFRVGRFAAVGPTVSRPC